MGLCVNGTIVGDDVFIAETLQADLDATGATINKIDSVLRDISAQALLTVNIKINQTLLQHHMQTIRPVVLAPLLRQLDACVMKSTSYAPASGSTSPRRTNRQRRCVELKIGSSVRT